MGVFVLKSWHWGRTSSVLGGPYGVGSKGSPLVPASPGPVKVSLPGPSPLGTKSACQHISWGLVRPTFPLAAWVFRGQGCGVGGTVLPSPHWGGSSLASPIPFPLVSSVTMYSPGPLPIFAVAPPAPPPYPGALGEALTRGVPGSLTLFLSCMGNPSISSNWPSQSYIWFSSRVGVGCPVEISLTACMALCHSSVRLSCGVEVQLTGVFS